MKEKNYECQYPKKVESISNSNYDETVIKEKRNLLKFVSQIYNIKLDKWCWNSIQVVISNCKI